MIRDSIGNYLLRGSFVPASAPIADRSILPDRGGRGVAHARALGPGDAGSDNRIGGLLDYLAASRPLTQASFSSLLGTGKPVDSLSDHPDLLEQWQSISRRLTRKKQIRTKLAHAQVLPNTASTEARLFAYYSLCEPGMPDWNGGWSAKTIRDFAADFTALTRIMHQTHAQAA